MGYTITMNREEFLNEVEDLAKSMEKASKRCWEGYKPTPGKKPYAEGSCMKKAEDGSNCGMCKACKSMKKADSEEKRDPIGPYNKEPVDESKPKITLPMSAIKRKKKEEAQMEKSEDLEKGRKPAPIGTKSPDGSRVKTAQGWMPVKGSGSSKKESSKTESSDLPKKNLFGSLSSKEHHTESDKHSALAEKYEKQGNKDEADKHNKLAGLHQQAGFVVSKKERAETAGDTLKPANKKALRQMYKEGISRIHSIYDNLFKKSEGENMTKEETEVLQKAKELGKDALSEVAKNLTPAQKELLGKVLSKAMAPSNEPLSTPKPKKVEDLPQEDVKPEGTQYEFGDRKDSDLVQEKMDEVKHQGDNSPEGFEGQKVEDPQTQPDWEAQAAPEQAQSKMAKSEEETEDLEKAMEEKMDELMTTLCKAGHKKEAIMEALKKKGKYSKKAESSYEKANSEVAKQAKTKADDQKAPEPKENDHKKEMKKSVVWNDWNSDALGNSAKRGHNCHWEGVSGYLEKSEAVQAERLSKGEFLNVEPQDELKKGEGEPSDPRKVSVNDLIEQHLDMSFDDIKGKQERAMGFKPNGTIAKSFSDEDLAKSMNMSIEEVNKILGK